MIKHYLVLGRVEVELQAKSPQDACEQVTKMLSEREVPAALYSFEVVPDRYFEERTKNGPNAR